MLRMDFGKGAKIISVNGSGVRDAGVAKHQREDRSEGSKDEQARRDEGGSGAIDALHEQRNGIESGIGLSSGVEFLPGNYPQNADVHYDV